MKVVFQTPPIRAFCKQPPDDVPVAGTCYFEAILFEPADAAQAKGLQLVSYWRSKVGPEGALRVPAGSKLVGVPDAVVPGSVLQALPADAALMLSFNWSRT